jgi:hypothetical protein
LDGKIGKMNFNSKNIHREASSLHSLSTTSAISLYPKPFSKSYREASSLHSLSTASAISLYPKPFKRMLRILLAFLMLASLQEHIRFAHYGLSVVFVLKQASTKSSTHPIHFVAYS